MESRARRWESVNFFHHPLQCNEILTLLHISTSIFEGFYNSS